MLVGSKVLELILMPVKASPVFLTIWLVVAYTIKFSESSDNFMLFN